MIHDFGLLTKRFENHWLNLGREIIAFYSENFMKHINIVYRKNAVP